ncbi:MAG: hypothetical protein AAF546_00265, partial [Verrucomicrobiota bacterium]
MSLQFGLTGPDSFDPNDYQKKVAAGAEALPIDLSLEYKIEPSLQVGNSCTGHSNAKLAQLVTAKATGFNISYSANFSYLHNRKNPHHDRGAVMRDASLSLVKKGVCHHDIWPDHVAPVPVPESAAAVPAQRCYKIPRMERVEHDPDLMCRILSIEKLGIKCGRQIWESAMDEAFKSRAGMYPLDTAQTNFLGYHDELIIGWEIIDGLRWFKLAGSWGL